MIPDSRAAVQIALSGGPLSIDKIAQRTSLHPSTVRRIVLGGDFICSGGWPRTYSVSTGVKEPYLMHYVSPTDFDREEVGEVWQEGKLAFSKDIARIDLNKLTLDVARHKIRAATATLLGLLVILDQLEDGPEWRMEIGL